MTEVVKIGNAELHLGDCLEVLRTLPDASIEAIVTDPPAGIGFMGKDWDHHKGGRQQWVAWMTDIAAECLRVLKPGGHALVWAIPRTSHWTATAWEDAGFEIRDRIAHCFGGGFPKSLDVSKAIDKAAGAEREGVGQRIYGDGHVQNSTQLTPPIGTFKRTQDERIETAPATVAAKQWSGWGTALKPAIEDWWLCRKPLDGTVAGNVLKHGVGGINVDGCRVGTREKEKFTDAKRVSAFDGNAQDYKNPRHYGRATTPLPPGRFPANLIHDGSDEVVGLFPQATARNGGNTGNDSGGVYSGIWGKTQTQTYTDSGSAARFFYCAKASKKDRDEGCEGLPLGEPPASARSKPAEGRQNPLGNPRSNHHPTVKPTALMTYLCRLITPPGGTILDPFMGSGSTGKAAMREGFRFIGIEREAEYLAIAQSRISAAQRQPDLFHKEAE